MVPGVERILTSIVSAVKNWKTAAGANAKDDGTGYYRPINELTQMYNPDGIVFHYAPGTTVEFIEQGGFRCGKGKEGGGGGGAAFGLKQKPIPQKNPTAVDKQPGFRLTDSPDSAPKNPGQNCNSQHKSSESRGFPRKKTCRFMPRFDRSFSLCALLF